MFKALLSSLALLTLAACSTSELLKSSEPQQTTYALRPANTAPLAETGLAQIVEITKPSVPPGFDTERIALYTDGGLKLDYFSAAKWPDILDNVLQDYTRRMMTSSLPYVVAIKPNQTLDANYRMEMKVNEFQPVYNSAATNAPELLVNIEFTLISLPANAVVRSFILSKQGMAESNRLDIIATNLETMLHDIEREAFTRFDTHFKKKEAVR